MFSIFEESRNFLDPNYIEIYLSISDTFLILIKCINTNCVQFPPGQKSFFAELHSAFLSSLIA